MFKDLSRILKNRSEQKTLNVFLKKTIVGILSGNAGELYGNAGESSGNSGESFENAGYSILMFFTCLICVWCTYTCVPEVLQITLEPAYRTDR